MIRTGTKLHVGIYLASVSGDVGAICHPLAASCTPGISRYRTSAVGHWWVDKPCIFLQRQVAPPAFTDRYRLLDIHDWRRHCNLLCSGGKLPLRQSPILSDIGYWADMIEFRHQVFDNLCPDNQIPRRSFLVSSDRTCNNRVHICSSQFIIRWVIFQFLGISPYFYVFHSIFCKM